MSDIVYMGIVVLILVFFIIYLIIAERLEDRRQDMHLEANPPPMTKYEDRK